MTTVRRWTNEAWDKSNEARSQFDLVYMFKKIMANADDVTNEPTPGHSREDLSRVIIAKSSMLPNIDYIIHMNGFTVEDITEIIKS